MSTSDLPRFPDGFLWGTATASYQIEGAVDADGRGPSIWDTFSHTPGAVAGDDTGDVACDHYHRYREDVALMKDLGVGAYRFSIAWPRILPHGKGSVNEAGLDFYRRLVDELLDNGITPMATLYHWDLPQPLEDAGGWRVRDTAERFAEYAAVTHAALGDRVPYWITLNEPFCSAFIGYAEGRHAPGAREGHGALAAAHHLLVGHGLAVAAMRDQRHGTERFGITLNMNHVTPATDAPADVAAAGRAELLSNRVFSDPLLGGSYPVGEHALWGRISDFSFRRDDDLAVITQPLDFLGVNNYFPEYAKDAPSQEPDPRRRVATDIGVVDNPPAHLPRTAMPWPVEADGLRRLLVWLRDTYPGLPPVYVTENGSAYPDSLVDGAVDDPDRIAYLDGHLRAVRAAIDDGVDVRGYFCWSMMDNFEWAYGYAKRFGLVYVDYATQQRIPKSSFRWYQGVVSR
ncbi:GH1 family beta-glucosidase [Actinocatenispora rupis]|uniref:Beta-glucosidase n=1 Tax=Actinocatenispora rupis TaxID=519421 RepID=A0A8J3J5A7_9ACTN|nr:GH1 family beta-glucosidase [Actinocatenispora rupis]GID16091.1 beta-glucosidase [Actinocatenispora rupis]